MLARPRIPRGAAPVLVAALAGCVAPGGPPPPSTNASPVYSPETGRLEQIVSDRNGDGTIDTRAFMDGARLQRIEIDRNGDSRPDRWEHFTRPAVARASAEVEIARIEEANGADERVTRREFYESGRVARVEEDTDLDGRIDKWEHYDQGRLVRLDLDLAGGGFPDRRMHYRADGTIDRVELDPEGRGAWRPAGPPQ